VRRVVVSRRDRDRTCDSRCVNRADTLDLARNYSILDGEQGSKTAAVGVPCRNSVLKPREHALAADLALNAYLSSLATSLANRADALDLD
jgi:hypothetical protein